MEKAGFRRQLLSRYPKYKSANEIVLISYRLRRGRGRIETLPDRPLYSLVSVTAYPSKPASSL